MCKLANFASLYVWYIFIAILLVTHTNGEHNKENQQIQKSSSETIIASVIESFLNLKENNLLRSGIDASIRSVFSKPLTSAVYALSMLVGVVAMLAFYESPVSPMPVPPLPDPPVGRFPPEHPIWPPPPKDAHKYNEKQRIGHNNMYSPPNITHLQNPFLHIMDLPQKIADPGYQHLLNYLENRNSKPNIKHNNKYELLEENIPDISAQSNSLHQPMTNCTTIGCKNGLIFS